MVAELGAEGRRLKAGGLALVAELAAERWWLSWLLSNVGLSAGGGSLWDGQQQK